MAEDDILQAGPACTLPYPPTQPCPCLYLQVGDVRVAEADRLRYRHAIAANAGMNSM